MYIYRATDYVHFASESHRIGKHRGKRIWSRPITRFVAGAMNNGALHKGAHLFVSHSAKRTELGNNKLSRITPAGGNGAGFPRVRRRAVRFPQARRRCCVTLLTCDWRRRVRMRVARAFLRRSSGSPSCRLVQRVVFSRNGTNYCPFDKLFGNVGELFDDVALSFDCQLQRVREEC